MWINIDGIFVGPTCHTGGRCHPFGYHKRRRRQDALLINIFTGERLQAQGLSCVEQFFDAKNVLCSLSFDSFGGPLSQALPVHKRFERSVLRQRYTRTVVNITTTDGVVGLWLGSGCLQGSENGGTQFLTSFELAK